MKIILFKVRLGKIWLGYIDEIGATGYGTHLDNITRPVGFTKKQFFLKLSLLSIIEEKKYCTLKKNFKN